MTQTLSLQYVINLKRRLREETFFLLDLQDQVCFTFSSSRGRQPSLKCPVAGVLLLARQGLRDDFEFCDETECQASRSPVPSATPAAHGPSRTFIPENVTFQLAQTVGMCLLIPSPTQLVPPPPLPRHWMSASFPLGDW